MPYIGTSPSNGVRQTYDYTATAGQTSFSGSDNNSQTLVYTDSTYIDVYQNGILLVPSDYTATTGTTVVLDTGATVSDTLQIVVYDVFSVADTVSASDGGSFGGNVGVGGTLSVTGAFTSQGIDDNADGTAITIDSSERVMIGTTTEGHADADDFTVSGSANSGITIRSGTSNQGQIFFSDGTSGDDEFRGIVGYNHSNNRLTLTSNAGTGKFELYSTGVQATQGDAAGAYIAVLANDGNNVNRYGMAISCGSDDASGTNYALRFEDGDGGGQGSITFSGGTVTYGAFTAFHPCVIPNADNDADSQDNAYPYGTLLEITSLSYSQKNGADTERGLLYNVQKSSSAKSKAVIGAYGSSMNGGPDEETNMHQTLILGDGHILCNNENGNIAIGDYICTSSASGEGMKATSICTTIGVAREAVSFTNSTAVLVAVEYGYRQFVPEDLEARITALENA